VHLLQASPSAALPSFRTIRPLLTVPEMTHPLISVMRAVAACCASPTPQAPSPVPQPRSQLGSRPNGKQADRPTSKRTPTSEQGGGRPKRLRRGGGGNAGGGDDDVANNPASQTQPTALLGADTWPPDGGWGHKEEAGFASELIEEMRSHLETLGPPDGGPGTGSDREVRLF
jgi:hypothetical protein